MNVTSNSLSEGVQNADFLFLTQINIWCRSTFMYIEKDLNILHAKLTTKSKKILLKVS